MTDGLRLAIGTFTRVPVPAPRRVDSRVARAGILWAPMVGLVLAVVIGTLAQLASDHAAATAGTLVIAALAFAAIAYVTRALHLDGLADTADALGSGRPAAEALEIARKSDIGPFGVVALVLVLLVQVTAYAGLIADGRALVGLVVAVTTGRVAVVLACRRGVPAARPDGLGAAVAGSVPGWACVIVAIGWLALATAATAALQDGHVLSTAVAIATGLAAGLLMVRTAVRRLGGITGDVLGSTVELATTACLVILVAVPG